MSVNRTTLAAAALLFWGCHDLALAQAVPETADSYHYAQWLGTSNLADYTEWWYFNFYDSMANVQAIFSYFVTNPNSQPGGLFPVGVSEMAVVAYTPGGVVPVEDVYPVRAFSAAYNAANVQVGGNSVTVIDPDTYQISGASREGQIAWNLTYTRAAHSWYAANRFSVGSEPWELMSWLLYMPAATVMGSITVNGISYNINASGYHDHNWGEWDLTGVPWNWAQYSQPGLTFDLGDFPNKPGGVASLDLDGRRFVFQNNQYTLTPTVWAYDSEHNVYYPVESVFEADNGAAAVSLMLYAQNTAPLSAPLPPSVPNAIIYEQTTLYSGVVSAGGRTITVFGNGFREYTALTP